MAKGKETLFTVTETFRSETIQEHKAALQQIIDAWIRYKLCG